MLSQCKRAIVLSGTPAVSNPHELFNLLKIIRPDIFIDPREFGIRYGNPEYNFFKKDFEYKGSCNEKELNAVLKHHMIRRLKKQVLTDLPDKTRNSIKIPIDGGVKNKISKIREKM